MLIPLGTDRPSNRPTLVTPLLIGVNVVIYVALAAIGAREPERQAELMLPFLLDPHHFKWFQPISSAFLHAGIWHIAGNMLFLWVFGPNIEDRLGRWWFLLFYTGGMWAAAGLHIAFEDAPALGASGAVAALTGAYLALFPRTQIRVLFLLFLRPISISAWWFIVGAFAWDLLGHGRGDSGIAHLAHIGGSLYGVSIMLILLWLHVLPREVYDLFSIARQAKRRRDLKEATADGTRRAKERWRPATEGKGREGVVSGEAIATARAEVSSFIAAGNLAAAADAYRALVNSHGPVQGAAVLSFRQLEQLAAHFYAARSAPAPADRESAVRMAAFTMERLIEAYPRENVTPRFRLLLAILLGRELGQPARARELLEAAIPQLHDESEVALARSELSSLTPVPAPPVRTGS